MCGAFVGLCSLTVVAIIFFPGFGFDGACVAVGTSTRRRVGRQGRGHGERTGVEEGVRTEEEVDDREVDGMGAGVVKAVERCICFSNYEDVQDCGKMRVMVGL